MSRKWKEDKESLIARREPESPTQQTHASGTQLVTVQVELLRLDSAVEAGFFFAALVF